LRLEYERIKCAVYFDKGSLIYAASNLRQHRLAETLRRWRVITEAQYASLPQECRNDTEAARALLERGVLTKEALEEVRPRLAADVLRPPLLWTTGGWSFEPRARITEDVRVQIELPELLLEAARRLSQNLAAKRFPNKNETLKRVTEPANKSDLLPLEAFVLSRIDVPLRLHVLLAISAMPEEETLHACYALALGGFVERDGWPRAFTEEDIQRALAIGAKAEAQSAAASSAARQAEAKKTQEESKQVEPEVDERRELEEMFERVRQATNHYQVLGVPRSIDSDALKQTYHRLARRFHPDRFHQDAEVHRRVEDAFAKIAQAYETLKDKSSRAAYDLKLSREPGVRPPATTESRSAPSSQRANPSATQHAAQNTSASNAATRAEDSFQIGLTELKAGNMAAALAAFAEAARIEPKTARYRAQYGQLLAANVQMRHRAETEIQAAIQLEPGNTAYRIMLAKLYQNLGFIKRAQAELERVQALDPQNAEAQKLLAELQSTQGTR
ncbi:MAG: DnaJ domain-containing protein, partial [Acidobacteria bacterium]|nr:DnaJ domain-containing protein [Acidobacteriota bacterium]